MEMVLLKEELDWKCQLLKEALHNEEACHRYEIMSRITGGLDQNRVYTYVDLKGEVRYVR